MILCPENFSYWEAGTGEVAAFAQNKNEGLDQKPNPEPTLYENLPRITLFKLQIKIFKLYILGVCMYVGEGQVHRYK